MSARARKPYSRPNVNEQWVHDKAPGVKSNNNLNNSNTARLPSSVNTAGNTKLLVSNLHYEITPKDLASIFGQIGTLVREPLIKYDRSGRSSGTAIISYDTPAEATRAKKQFDGLLAKGQPMSIVYDTHVPHLHPRRSASAPGSSTSSLINRIQRPPLKDRLTSEEDIQMTDGPSLTGTYISEAQSVQSLDAAAHQDHNPHPKQRRKSLNQRPSPQRIWIKSWMRLWVIISRRRPQRRERILIWLLLESYNST
ncbi:tho complex subunit 4-a-like [Moniliophthora roreri MCA 2997]|uniref:Tho complex subunit 4-a-like n=1 Tax=Moniliophthora roreri (strain MCA 2997) TaxID=1381753 RepID=V2YEX3_MONRO|nr:tho complex subunit 4-a-like [Moniliophthora roreri MCA 2997]